MKSPTRSVAVIRRQLTRARRDRVMVTLHPDTVEWLVSYVPRALTARETKEVVRALAGMPLPESVRRTRPLRAKP